MSGRVDIRVWSSCGSDMSVSMVVADNINHGAGNAGDHEPDLQFHVALLTAGSPRRGSGISIRSACAAHEL